MSLESLSAENAIQPQNNPIPDLVSDPATQMQAIASEPQSPSTDPSPIDSNQAKTFSSDLESLEDRKAINEADSLKLLEINPFAENGLVQNGPSLNPKTESKIEEWISSKPAEILSGAAKEIFKTGETALEMMKKPGDGIALLSANQTTYPPDVQFEIDARRIKHRSNPAALANLNKLVDDPGFKTLSPGHQKQMLATTDKAPTDIQLTKSLTKLANDPNFRNIHDRMATVVIGRLGSATPNARENYVKLATTQGFTQLNYMHQTKMLEAMDKSPGDASLADDLVRLASSENFRGQNDNVKSEIIDGLKTHSVDQFVRSEIVDLGTCAGLHKLSDADKLAIVKVATGTTPEYSGAARAELNTLLSRSDFATGTPDYQSAELKKFLDTQSFLPGATTAPVGTFAQPGMRVPYAVQGNNILIDGRVIPVTVNPAPPGKAQLSVDDIAKTIAATPKASRDEIKGVIIEPQERPGAYMAASGDGIVHTYPVNQVQGEDFNASAMIHETGHIVSQKRYGGQTSDPRWNAWKQAMAKDSLSPSKYAHGKPTDAKTAGGGVVVQDDFAESYLLYKRVKGTPQEAEM